MTQHVETTLGTSTGCVEEGDREGEDMPPGTPAKQGSWLPQPKRHGCPKKASKSSLDHHLEPTFVFSREIQTILEYNQVCACHRSSIPNATSAPPYLESIPKHLSHCPRNSFYAHAILCLPFYLSLRQLVLHYCLTSLLTRKLYKAKEAGNLQMLL